jgi:hypothetical protein
MMFTSFGPGLPAGDAFRNRLEDVKTSATARIEVHASWFVIDAQTALMPGLTVPPMLLATPGILRTFRGLFRQHRSKRESVTATISRPLYPKKRTWFCSAANGSFGS